MTLYVIASRDFGAFQKFKKHNDFENFRSDFGVS